MKYLIILAIGLFLFSCNHKRYEWKYVVISGKDTVEFDNGNTYIKSGAGHGWTDTINHIFYLEFTDRDTVFIYDTIVCFNVNDSTYSHIKNP